MKSKTSPLDHLVGELKNQCNKYMNGSCQTLSCLKRGGYKRGEKPNYEVATCERHEQVKALEALLYPEPKAIPESKYWKAVRTGIKPKIWPPITMTKDELDHFRSYLQTCADEHETNDMKG